VLKEPFSNFLRVDHPSCENTCIRVNNNIVGQVLGLELHLELLNFNAVFTVDETMLLKALRISLITYQLLDVVLHRNLLNASEKVERLPSRKYFDEFGYVGRVRHRLEHDTHYEAEVVLEMFNVLSLHLLNNTVHDIKVGYLFCRVGLGGLSIRS
jgi:hypothetical protein